MLTDRVVEKKFKEAKNTPDEPIFTTKDLMKIFHVHSQVSIEQFDKTGLIKAFKTPQRQRFYTYNQIMYLKKLQILIKADFSFFAIKALNKKEKSEGRNPDLFIDGFSKFYKRFFYNSNRNAARKENKNKRPPLKVASALMESTETATCV